MKKLGIIGCGNMGEALLKGILAQKTIAPDEILVSVRRSIRQTYLDNTYGIKTSLDNISVLEAEVIVLGVKPKDYENVLLEIKDHLREEQIIMTMAPGYSIAAISQLIEHKAKVVRTMPNTPVGVGEGVVGIAFDKKISTEDKASILDLLSSLGLVVEVEESQMVAIGSLSGSAPAFLCMLMEAMADVGVSYGLPRDKAYQVVAQTLVGSGKLLLETGLHPGVLKDQVTSPKGTTIAGCIALEQKGFRGSIMEGLIQTGELFKQYEKSIEEDIRRSKK